MLLFQGSYTRRGYHYRSRRPRKKIEALPCAGDPGHGALILCVCYHATFRIPLRVSRAFAASTSASSAVWFSFRSNASAWGR